MMTTKMAAVDFFSGDLNGTHLYFVGIKGTGMAALAEICCFRRARVSGSDVADIFYTDEVLKNIGITPLIFDKNNITPDIDLIVYSSAYKPDVHPELIAAKVLGIPMLLYTEALGAISASAYSCGIAGVHGKTSLTGMTGTLVRSLRLPAQVLAGSLISSFGNEASLEQDGKILSSNSALREGTVLAAGSCTLNLGNRFFIAETCEYQRHFMSFHPQKIILTSVESDHQDYYPTYESIRDAFIDYCCLLPHEGDLIYCADNAGAAETVKLVLQKRPDIHLIPYGIEAEGDYRIKIGAVKEEKQFFSLAGFSGCEKETGSLQLSVPGRHNVLNAAGACALAVRLYDEFYAYRMKNLSALAQPEKLLLYAKLQKGLNTFKGARRRCEITGHFSAVIQDGRGIYSPTDILLIDDYGHHPTAIKTTLEGLREFYPGRYIIVDFMSHTYTRTAALINEFASSFGAADCVILHKIYASAREQYTGSITGMSLYERTKKCHPNVQYFEEAEDALSPVLKLIKKITGEQKILFVTMGAGDNWKLGKILLRALTEGKIQD